MAIYEYRCDRHGPVEVRLPIGTAPASVTCSQCGGEAGRVFSTPMTRTRVPRPLVAALEHEEKTRHEPDVVTSLPPRPVRQRTPVAPLTPTLARLPRP